MHYGKLRRNINYTSLTHLFRMHHFCTPWEHQKTFFWKRFSDVFMGYRKGALGTNGLTLLGFHNVLTSGYHFYNQTVCLSRCFQVNFYKWKNKVNFCESFIALFGKSKFFIFIWKIRSDSKSRSSRPEVFLEKGALRSFAKFTGKHLCQSLFFNKVAGLRPVSGGAAFSGTLAQVFSSRFCEISKSTFNTLKVLKYVIIFKWAH